MYRLANSISSGDWTVQDNALALGGQPSYFSETIALLKSIDFTKVDIRVAEVLKAEPVPKSNKLLRLTLDAGEEAPRVVLSGIAEFYSPSDLIGSQVCVIVNLKPAKLMGEMSYGMILASKDSSGLSLARVERRLQNGSKIS